jgi:hypothetical protein
MDVMQAPRTPIVAVKPSSPRRTCSLEDMDEPSTIQNAWR